MNLPPVSPSALAVADTVIGKFPSIKIGMRYPSDLPENTASEDQWARHQVAAVLQAAMAALTVADCRRLDGGAIRLIHRDEFGNDMPTVHTGINLRAAIDAAQT